MADPIVHITNGIPDTGTGNITTLGQTLTDGANAAIGATTDVAVTAGAAGSVNAHLRSISRDIVGGIVLQGGANVIGAVTQSGGPWSVSGTVAATQSGTWNITNISGTVSLPTGAATAANQPTNASLGSATAGQTGHLNLAAVSTAAPAYTNGQTNALSLTTTGALRVDGSAVTQPISGTITASQGGAPWTIKPDGTAWALTGTSANVNVTNASIAVTGTFWQATQPISAASLPLPSGASTAALQPTNAAQGSTTSGQTGPLVQAAVTTAAPAYTNGQTSPLSLTPAGAIRVDGSAVTQPVSGTVTVNGTVTANQGGTWSTRLQDGSGNAITSDARGSERPLSVQILDASGNQVTTFGGAGGTSSNYGSAFPTAGTAAGFSDGTNMQGARVFDADSGAGFQYVLGVNLRASGSGGSTEIGVSSAPLRVDPTGTTTQPVSGTFWQATQPISAASLPLPSGAATSANQPTAAAIASTTSGQTGGLSMGAVTTGLPSYTTAQTDPLSLTTSGLLRVDGSNVTQPVSMTSTTITGTVAVTQSGTWNINNISGTVSLPTGAATSANQPTNAALGSTTSGQTGLLGLGAVTTAAPSYTTGQTNAFSLTTAGLLRTDGSGVTQPISGTVTASQGGTWTVQPGNTANTTPWLMTINQGGNSASVTASSALKVDGSAVTQPVSGTVTANQGGNWTSRIVGNVGAVFDFAGQNAAAPANSILIGGEFNTTPTTISSGNASPLQLDSAGNLRVNIMAGAGSGGTASTVGAAVPSQATAAGYSDGTNMQLARVFDGDSGAGTQYSLGVLLKTPANGGAVDFGVSGQPIRIDPTGTTTQPVSGTVTANIGTSGSLALESGGNLASIKTDVDNLNLAQGSTTSGQKGSLPLGAVTTGAPTYTTGQSSPLSLTTAGALRVDGSAVTQPVSGTFWQATQPVSIAAAVTVQQSTAGNLKVDLSGTAANATAIKVDGSAVTQPVSGTVTAAQATAANLKAQVDPLTTANWGLAASTQNVAAPTNGMLVQAQFNTTPTTISSGNISPLQLDSAGNLLVNIKAGAGSGGTASNFGAAFPSAGTAIGVKDNAGTNMTFLQADGANNLRVTNNPVIWNTTGTAWNSSTTLNSTQTIWDGTQGIYQGVSGQLTQGSTLTAGAVTFEESFDVGVTWKAIPVYRLIDPATGAQLTNPYTFVASTNQAFEIVFGAPSQIRIRLSTAITGTGSVTPAWSKMAGSQVSQVVSSGTFPMQIFQGGNYAIVSAAGALKVDGSAVTQPVSGTFWQATQPISGTVTANQGGSNWSQNVTQFGGTNISTGTGVGGAGIPRVTVSSDSVVGISGTVAATQSGTWTVQPGNTANTTPWLVTAASATAPVSTMNSASANSGLNAALAGVFDDVTPTAITENNFGFLRMSTNRNLYGTIRDAAGNERGVNVTTGNALTVDGSATTQPVSIAAAVTVAQATAANLKGQVDPLTAANWGIGTSTQNSASVANGHLVLGQFNTTPTAITSGNMSPFQLDTNGNLLVNVKAGGGAGGTSSTFGAAFPGTGTAAGAQYLSTLPTLTSGQMNALLLDVNGNLRVSTPANVAAGSTWNSSTTINTTQAISNNPSILGQVTVTTTITAGALTFEESYDNGTTWLSVPAGRLINPATGAQIANPYTLVASTNLQFQIVSTGTTQIRVRLSTAITGTGSAAFSFTSSPLINEVQVYQNNSANLLGTMTPAAALSTVNWTSATALNATFALASSTTQGYAAICGIINTTSTITAGQVTFEESFDGGLNYNFISVSRIIDPASGSELANPLTLFANNKQAFQIISAGSTNVRARLSTQITGTGTASVFATQSSMPVNMVVTQQSSGNLLTQIFGAITSTPPSYSAGSNGGFTLDTFSGMRVSGSATAGNTASSFGMMVVGGVAATANPSAATAGNIVNPLWDKVGKQITAGAIRTLKGVQKTSITTASETTVVTAGSSGVFNDVYAFIVTNKSATGVFVDFKDSTGGTTRMTLAAPANDTRGFTVPVDSAMTQATAANNWTATVSSAVTSIEITALYVQNV